MSSKPILWAVGLLLAVLFLASVLAYRQFQDADYASAWWSLTWLLGSPIPLADKLTARAALAIALLSSLTIGLFVALTFKASRGRRIILGSTAALFWISSPWQVVALQNQGVYVHLLLIPALLLAFLAGVFLTEKKLLLVLTTVVAFVVFQSVIAFQGQQLSAAAILLPPPAALGAWKLLSLFEIGLTLLALLGLVLTLLWIVKYLTRNSEFSFGPVCLLLLLVPACNAFMLSEQLQIRGNPRLALLYSLSYPSPSAAELWLASEYFDFLGSDEISDGYRARAALLSFDSTPTSYRVPLSCIQGTEEEITDGQAASMLVVAYLRRQERCQ